MKKIFHLLFGNGAKVLKLTGCSGLFPSIFSILASSSGVYYFKTSIALTASSNYSTLLAPIIADETS